MASNPLDRAADLLHDARRVVVLTGAGMSQESGVPTFRDALSGWWSRFDPAELATPEAFRCHPARVFGWYLSRWRAARAAQPHAGHRALVELAPRFDRFLLVTQNVDGLHQRAGSPDVVELHGSLEAFRCFDNRHAFDAAALADLPHTDEVEPPPCGVCGSSVRPGVVWFGEYLPRTALERGLDEAADADAVIVVGTSAVVYPAAAIADVAVGQGVPVIEINPEPTPLSPRVACLWAAPAGDALRRLAARLTQAVLDA